MEQQQRWISHGSPLNQMKLAHTKTPKRPEEAVRSYQIPMAQTAPTRTFFFSLREADCKIMQLIT